MPYKNYTTLGVESETKILGSSIEKEARIIAKELKKIDSSNAYLKKGIKFLNENTSTLLQFVKKAEELMCRFSKEENRAIEVLQKMWEQLQYCYYSRKYNVIEGEIGLLLDNRYTEIREKWNKMLKQIVRASSLVECMNSLIRPYLFLKHAKKSIN